MKGVSRILFIFPARVQLCSNIVYVHQAPWAPALHPHWWRQAAHTTVHRCHRPLLPTTFIHRKGTHSRKQMFPLPSSRFASFCLNSHFPLKNNPCHEEQNHQADTTREVRRPWTAKCKPLCNICLDVLDYDRRSSSRRTVTLCYTNTGTINQNLRVAPKMFLTSPFFINAQNWARFYLFKSFCKMFCQG